MAGKNEPSCAFDFSMGKRIIRRRLTPEKET